MEKYDTVDLTGPSSGEEPKKARAETSASSRSLHTPFGVDVSFDVFDLFNDDHDDGSDEIEVTAVLPELSLALANRIPKPNHEDPRKLRTSTATGALKRTQETESQKPNAEQTVRGKSNPFIFPKETGRLDAPWKPQHGQAVMDPLGVAVNADRGQRQDRGDPFERNKDTVRPAGNHAIQSTMNNDIPGKVREQKIVGAQRDTGRIAGAPRKPTHGHPVMDPRGIAVAGDSTRRQPGGDPSVRLKYAVGPAGNNAIQDSWSSGSLGKVTKNQRRKEHKKRKRQDDETFHRSSRDDVVHRDTFEREISSRLQYGREFGEVGDGDVEDPAAAVHHQRSRIDEFAWGSRPLSHESHADRAPPLNDAAPRAMAHGEVDSRTGPPPAHAASWDWAQVEARARLDSDSPGRNSRGMNGRGRRGGNPFGSSGRVGNPRYQQDVYGRGQNIKHHWGSDAVAGEQQARLERELNIRKKELEALTAAQAVQQRVLDTQAVALEGREREFETRKRDIDAAHSELKRETAAKKQEIEVMRQQRQTELETSRRELNRERSELDRLVATTKRELEVLQLKQEREMGARSSALQNQFREFEVARANFARDVDAQRRQLDTGRRELENSMEIQKQEYDDLTASIDEQNAREKAWNDMKARVEAAHANKEKELETWAATQAKQQKELRKLKNDLEVTQARQREELQGWAVSKARQQEDLEAWIREVESVQTTKLEELDTRAAAQAKLQNELDVRAASLRKRNKELRAMKKEIDVTQVKLKQTNESAADLALDAAEKDQQGRASNSQADCPAAGGGSKPSQDGANRMANDADQQDVGEENRQAQKPGDTCGFILIDSDSDNDTLKSKASARQPHAGSKQPNSTPGVAAAAAPRAPPPERFHFKFEQRYNYDLSEETALEMQERLFREAAAKMRSQPSVRVTSADLTDSSFSIKTPIFDVADRFPDHWTWKDPYSVLGLPLNSSAQLVKSQFRRLARTYHPDKSADMNTSAKFHSIASAYHKLSGHF